MESEAEILRKINDKANRLSASSDETKNKKPSFLALFTRSSTKSNKSNVKAKFPTNLPTDLNNVNENALTSIRSRFRNSKKSRNNSNLSSHQIVKKQLSNLSHRSRLSANKNYHKLDEASFTRLGKHLLSKNRSASSIIPSNISLPSRSTNSNSNSSEKINDAVQLDRNLAVQAFALQQVYSKAEERQELEMARAFELDMLVSDSRIKEVSHPRTRLLSTVSNRFLLSDENRVYHHELMKCDENNLYHPNTHFRKAWDLLTLILIMYTSLTTPFILAFYDFNPYYQIKRNKISTYSVKINN